MFRPGAGGRVFRARIVDNNEFATESTSAEPSPASETEVKTAPGRGGLAQGALATLRENAQDILIVAGLVGLFCLVHRRVEVVEFGGDAVAKWQFARQWWYHFDWKTADLDHHSGRMGVNALAWLSQALFGRGWKTYSVAPFFIMTVQLPFLYGVCKRVMNRLAGIIAVLLLTYLETVHRSASQLLPDGFAGAYAIIATYFYLRFAQGSDKNRRAFLYAMAGAAFVGYLAKETFVFFYPGMVIAVWMARRNWRDVVAFLGTLFAGLMLETALYAAFTKYSSRYAIVRSVHGADGIWPQVTFAQLFERFDHFHNGWKYLFFFSLASGLWLLVLNVHRPLAGRAVALIGFSQVFFLTFMVRGINPIEMWESFEPRYIEPFAPFAVSLSGAFLGHLIATLWQRQPWPKWVDEFGPARPSLVAVWSLGLLFLVGSCERALGGSDRREDAFAVGRRLARATNDAYERNLPLAEQKRVKTKVLTVMYDVYLDDKRLVRDGKLPNLIDVARYERGYTYLVKSPAAYGRGKFAQMLDAGCVLAVSRTRAGYQLSSWDPLPASCDELLRAPTTR